MHDIRKGYLADVWRIEVQICELGDARDFDSSIRVVKPDGYVICNGSAVPKLVVQFCLTLKSDAEILTNWPAAI